MGEKILEVKHLKTYFHTDAGLSKAVNDVSFSVEKKKTLGIVGESGCGKSITSLSIMGLVEIPPGQIAGGEIIFEGEDLLKKSEKEMSEIRGKKIAMIFQEPMTSLNPVFTVGQQITEALMLHEKLTKREARKKGIEMLKKVKIPLAEKRFDEYPHQLSGGMRQRVMIAMALCCNPDLLICDEPTTALDVTIQAQILELINELKEETGTSVMMITHDLGVIAEVADDVMVMYAGKVVEYATGDQIFEKPMHPYTHGLMSCIPKLDGDDTKRLSVIEGMVPSFDEMPKGCAFCPRCPEAKDICRQKMPKLAEAEGRYVRCFKYTQEWEETGNE
ncbi:MAG: ABC transporter ATP-binding protein [Candidatus Avilachnospira sp.]|jgi:oligopeptide/dipeptide ABC transporter ATP-binding protein